MGFSWIFSVDFFNNFISEFLKNWSLLHHRMLSHTNLHGVINALIGYDDLADQRYQSFLSDSRAHRIRVAKT